MDWKKGNVTFARPSKQLSLCGHSLAACHVGYSVLWSRIPFGLFESFCHQAYFPHRRSVFLLDLFLSAWPLWSRQSLPSRLLFAIIVDLQIIPIRRWLNQSGRQWLRNWKAVKCLADPVSITLPLCRTDAVCVPSGQHFDHYPSCWATIPLASLPLILSSQDVVL